MQAFYIQNAKHQVLQRTIFNIPCQYFPGSLVVKNSCQHRRHGLHPWSGKIPHAPEQLSPHATSIEPVLQSLASKTNESMCHNQEGYMLQSCALQQDKSLQREVHALQRRVAPTYCNYKKACAAMKTEHRQKKTNMINHNGKYICIF